MKNKNAVTPPRPIVSEETNSAYVETLKKLINCKTVFTNTGENDGEFQRFREIVATSFPTLHARAEYRLFGSGCFFYILKNEGAAKNLLLMSHHDVVEGGDGWETDPFVATEKDGCLYGRGTIDTKISIFAILMAVEELLSAGYTFPGVNLYIGSSNNEELSGDGMPLAVESFRNEGVRFDTILDEGGAITEGMIPGVERKSAMIAVHEKGRHFFTCEASTDTAGHVSLSSGRSDSAVSRLAAFITEVEKKKCRIYKPSFSPEVRETFLHHVPFMPFPLSFLFRNLSLFAPIIRKVMMKIPSAGQMLTTSVSFTTVSAGDGELPQVKAKTAATTMYLRCVREEDLYQGLGKIRKIAEKHGVTITAGERDYCKPTPVDCPSFRVTKETLAEVFPDVIVAPYLLTAGTDARRFTAIADDILRFAPVDLSRAQFGTIHNKNENITLKNVGECVLFYKRFVENYCRAET